MIGTLLQLPTSRSRPSSWYNCWVCRSSPMPSGCSSSSEVQLPWWALPSPVSPVAFLITGCPHTHTQPTSQPPQQQQHHNSFELTSSPSESWLCLRESFILGKLKGYCFIWTIEENRLLYYTTEDHEKSTPFDDPERRPAVFLDDGKALSSLSMYTHTPTHTTILCVCVPMIVSTVRHLEISHTSSQCQQRGGRGYNFHGLLLYLRIQIGNLFYCMAWRNT